MTEDEIVGSYHWLSGHEFEQTTGDSEGQESLVCCSPWGHKELDMTVIQTSVSRCFLLFDLRPNYGGGSVQFSCSVVSDYLQPHESWHTRPPCPSPTAGVHSNSCLSSR